MSNIAVVEYATGTSQRSGPLRAIVYGIMSTLLFLLFALMCLAPFYGLLNFWIFPVALRLDSALTSEVPWLSILILFISAAFGSATTVARYGSDRGMLVVFFQALVLAGFLSVPWLLEKSPTTFRILLAIPIPIAGLLAGRMALLQRRFTIPRRFRNWVWPMFTISGMLTGTCLVVFSTLLLVFWPRREHIDVPDPPLLSHALDAEAWPARVLLATGFTLVVASLLRLRFGRDDFAKKRRGRLLLLSLLLGAGIGFGFIRRHRENHPSVLGYIASDTFFVDSIDEETFEYIPRELTPHVHEFLELAGAFSPWPEYGVETSLLGVPGYTASEDAKVWFQGNESQIQALLAFLSKGPIDLSKLNRDDHALDIQKAAGILCIHARILAQNGSVPAAMEVLSRTRRLAESVDPRSLGGQWIALSIERGLIQSTKEILAWRDLSSDEIRCIYEHLIHWEATPLQDFERWARAFAGDKNTMKLEGALHQWRSNTGILDYASSQFFSRDAIIAMGKQETVACTDHNDWMMASECLEDYRMSSVSMETPDLYEHPLSGVLQLRCGSMAARLFGDAGLPRIVLNIQARRRLLIAYTLAYEHILDDESLRLEQLAVWLEEQLPEDPYGKDTLQMKIDAGELVIYSLGENLSDDDGEGFFSRTDSNRFTEHGNIDIQDLDIVLRIPYADVRNADASPRYVRKTE